MSNTRIFGFNREGIAYWCIDIRNAWRGAMAIWRTMEKRHLPQYVPECYKDLWWYKPDMTAEELERILGYIPSRMTSGMLTGEKDQTHEIWELANNKEVPEHERICLYTTFDNVLVKKEDIPKVIEAFRKFDGETSLKEQADALEKFLHNEECIAVGWNQNDINCGDWDNAGGYNKETDEFIPYNCLTMDQHWWLFDELELNDET